MRSAAAFALGVVMVVPTLALADPCEGQLPKRGTAFEGVVVYVGDGDSLCSAPGGNPDPKTWVEVRLADYYAPELNDAGGKEAKAALEAVAQGKRIVCVARNRSYDRIVAVCALDGKNIGDTLRKSGAIEGGKGR